MASRAFLQPKSKTRHESSDEEAATDDEGSWINSSGNTQNLMQNDFETNADRSNSHNSTQSLVSLGNTCNI